MTGLRMNEAERESGRRLLELALEEDHAHEDVTSQLTLRADATAVVEVRNRSQGRVAGGEVVGLGLSVYGSSATATVLTPDGSACAPGCSLVRIEGRWRDIVAVERSVLNLMGMLSGTATMTDAFVEAVGESCQVLDTRKTIPGARLLQKYAVRCGGGVNHRIHLGDGFLLKDNHRNPDIAWGDLVRRARELGPEVPVVIEVDSLQQFDEVLPLEPDRILLDNFDLDMIREARARRDAGHSPVGLEVSGGVGLDRVAEIAAAGADCVSVGALTHSAPAWDIGLDLLSMTG